MFIEHFLKKFFINLQKFFLKKLNLKEKVITLIKIAKTYLLYNSDILT